MILFLFGPNTFVLKRKLSEIISRYKEKYKSNINLYRIDGKEKDPFSKFKEAIETTSMFKIKKLIIFENVLLLPKTTQQDLQKYLNQPKFSQIREFIRTNSHLHSPKFVPQNSHRFALSFAQIRDNIVIFTQEGEVKKDLPFFVFLKRRSFKKQEFKELSPTQLRAFIKREISRLLCLSGKTVQERNLISNSAVSRLIELFGDDPWEIESELKKLIAFKKGKRIAEKDVENLCSSQAFANIFQALQAIGENNKEKALKFIFDLRKSGQTNEKIFPMIVFQFRNIIKIKSYLSCHRNFSPYYQRAISQKLNIHPFVFKKNLPLAKKFDLPKLKEIYQDLLSLDFQIKTGKTNPAIAIDTFLTNL